MKNYEELPDRELQIETCKLLEKIERHQYYFSSVITIGLVLCFIGVCAYLLFK